MSTPSLPRWARKPVVSPKMEGTIEATDIGWCLIRKDKRNELLVGVKNLKQKLAELEEDSGVVKVVDAPTLDAISMVTDPEPDAAIDPEPLVIPGTDIVVGSEEDINKDEPTPELKEEVVLEVEKDAEILVDSPVVEEKPEAPKPAPKKKGRRKMTDEEKAAAKAKREEAKAKDK